MNNYLLKNFKALVKYHLNISLEGTYWFSIRSLKKYFQTVVVIMMLGFSLNSELSFATISGAHGISHTSDGQVSCDENDVSGLASGSYFKGGACSIPVNGYVPVSGQYRVKLLLTSTDRETATSTPFYIDATKSLGGQNLVTGGTNVPISVTSQYSVHVCYMLVDEAGNEWALSESRGCSGITPIPPTPPQPPTSCSINNGNALNVNLGTIDRAQLVTVPGTGSARHIQIPINCTGNVTSIPVNMQLSYTAISVSGKQVVKSSANGLGVSIIYSQKILSPSDVTPLQFIPGSNLLDLAFEAIRDPNVIIGDVPTGAFTASATVIMTQQ